MRVTILAAVLLFLGGWSMAEPIAPAPNITAIVDGVPYGCGVPPPVPEYQRYCTCTQLFGRTSLNLMAFNPQTAEEKKVRVVQEFSGSAVYPAIENCRKALQEGDFAECGR